MRIWDKVKSICRGDCEKYGKEYKMCMKGCIESYHDIFKFAKKLEGLEPEDVLKKLEMLWGRIYGVQKR